MNGAYLEFFRAGPPARATLAVSALLRPAARVEIKCSAVIARRWLGAANLTALLTVPEQPN